MLACVVATGSAKVMFKDSVYTLNLRRRGLRPGGRDLNLLHRITVEQVDLEPVLAFPADAPLQKLLEGTEDRGATDVIVLDSAGEYLGMVTADDVNTALVQREAIPLLLVGEMLRPELPCVKNTDDLASVLEAFSRHEVSRLPVCLAANPKRVIGLDQPADADAAVQPGAVVKGGTSSDTPGPSGPDSFAGVLGWFAVLVEKRPATPAKAGRPV